MDGHGTDNCGFSRAVARIEAAGAAFYRAMAARYPEGHMRELFEFFASEEDTHAAKWGKACDTHPELDEALERAGDLLFFIREESAETGRLSDQIVTGEQGLKLALVGEKDSILFYSEIRARTTSPEAAAALDMVIAEERRHFSTLYTLLKIFRSASRWPQADPDEMDRLLREAVAEDESRR